MNRIKLESMLKDPLESTCRHASLRPRRDWENPGD